MVERLRDWRDEHAWNEFYTKYRNFVEGIARKRGNSPHDAEDAAQKVFQRVAETIHEFEHHSHRGSFRKWLGNLSRWKACEVARNNNRHQARVERVSREGMVGEGPTEPGSADDPEAEFKATARKELIQIAISRLSSKYGAQQIQVYQLLVVDGWPVAKVADFCRVSRNNVYVIKNRLGRRLREELSVIRKQLSCP